MDTKSKKDFSKQNTLDEEMHVELTEINQHQKNTPEEKVPGSVDTRSNSHNIHQDKAAEQSIGINQSTNEDLNNLKNKESLKSYENDKNKSSKHLNDESSGKISKKSTETRQRDRSRDNGYNRVREYEKSKDRDRDRRRERERDKSRDRWQRRDNDRDRSAEQEKTYRRDKEREIGKDRTRDINRAQEDYSRDNGQYRDSGYIRNDRDFDSNNNQNRSNRLSSSNVDTSKHNCSPDKYKNSNYLKNTNNNTNKPNNAHGDTEHLLSSKKKTPVSIDDLKKLKFAQEETCFFDQRRTPEASIRKTTKRNTIDSGIISSRHDDSRRYRNSNRERDLSNNRDADRQSILEKKQKEAENRAIRERYIGATKEKRKVRKMNEKNFVFDWDAKEDTSQDFNDLYNNRHEPQFFGRGHLAGFDIKEQMAKKSQFYQGLLSERRTQEESNRLRDYESKIRKKEELLKWDDRHWSEKSLEKMKERDWRIFKEDFNISCKGGSIPNPIRSWRESILPKSILDVISKVGYEKPSPIQRQAIPIGLQNRDIIGIAETGSGKTASFLIPMLVYILGLPKIDDTNKSDGPYAIILAPTRELAQQIEQETLKFCKILKFTCVSIVGGRSIDDQAFSLRNGAEIIIATPGRLRDCIDRRILVLNQATYVVMDEADRMVDMGFEDDVNYILDAFPSTHIKPDTQEAEDSAKMLELHAGTALRYRQTTMFSATMPPAVERLARKYLRRPAIVTIGTAGQAVDTVVQRVEFISSIEKKRLRLMEIIYSDYKPPIIIFVNLKKSADFLFKSISKDHECVVLHGGKSQDQREAALSKLKSGEADILIATDVAGRGIDVKDVSLVINFDMAKTIEDYTHRIGRTGRAGKYGEAITFLTNDDADVMYDLRKMIEKSQLSKCPIELTQHEASQAPPGVTKSKRRFEETVYKD
ncbi:hypothetical protein BB561_006363 [Smittium simulii]|uniref:RNA helicase n=1 Tax=Smittium simulii TaxID=133385 RepID=A0A2T9Y4W5_9FUNG|nr:hypothetical protein BB561_006363 [Smittium simulii]